MPVLLVGPAPPLSIGSPTAKLSPVGPLLHPLVALPDGKLTVTTPVAQPATLDVGERLAVTTAAAGGIGWYTFNWSNLPGGCASENSSAFTCRVSEIGAYNVSVRVEDSAFRQAVSGPVRVVVVADPAPSINTSSDAGKAPLPVYFSVSVSGGIAPFAAVWAFGDGTVGNGLAIGHTFYSGGTFNVSVAITDSAGSLGRDSVSVVVNATAPTQASLPPPADSHPVPTDWYLITGAIVVGATILLLWRRRRREAKAPVVPPIPEVTSAAQENPYVPPPGGGPNGAPPVRPRRF